MADKIRAEDKLSKDQQVIDNRKLQKEMDFKAKNGLRLLTYLPVYFS